MNRSLSKPVAVISAGIHVVVYLMCLWCISSLPPGAVWAQSAEGEAPAPSKEAEQQPALTGISDLVSKTADLAERANDLEPKLAALFDEAMTKRQLEELGGSVREIGLRFKQYSTTGGFNMDQINEIKTELRKSRTELKKITGGVGEALTNLEVLEKSWREEMKRLEDWKSLLNKDASLQDVKSVLKRGQQTVKKSLALISAKLKNLVEVEEKASEIQGKILPLTEEINLLLDRHRRDILASSGPPMYTLAFLKQFDVDLAKSLAGGIAAVKSPPRSFLAGNAWLLLLQLLIAIVIPVAIYRYRQDLTAWDELRFLANRPMASGIFISLFALSHWYKMAPQEWWAVIWIMGSIAAARTARPFLDSLWRKWLLYGMAVLLSVLQMFRIFNLPVPLLGLFLFGMSGIGLVLCVWRSIARSRQGKPAGFTVVLRLGAVVFAAVLITEVLGYGRLSQHIMDAALKTVFLALAAWMFSRVACGLLSFAVRSAHLQRIHMIRVRTHVVISKMAAAVNLLFGVLFLSLMLVTWKPALHPEDILEDFLDLGFTIGEWRLTVGVAVGAAIIFYGSILASRMVQTILKEEFFPRRQVEYGVRISIARLVHYAFVSAGFLMTLKALGFSLQNVTIIGGALSIGIGFGLQAIVNNFVSGLILLFERPIKVGDMIQIDDQAARIKKVGLRATIVETYDRAEIVVPNSDLISNKVTNWTLADRTRRISISIGVAYGSDVPRVMEILHTCAAENADVLKEPETQVLFMAFGESSLDFQLRIWIDDVDKGPKVISALNLDIERRFREAGIEIPFPQRDLHLRSIDAKALSGAAAIFRETAHVPK
ncbi:MAG: mechanosensitive ion channel domain-containing protein [Thermodesulfobacteriota bacterium]